jgi:hypothetical protein
MYLRSKVGDAFLSANCWRDATHAVPCARSLQAFDPSRASSAPTKRGNARRGKGRRNGRAACDADHSCDADVDGDGSSDCETPKAPLDRRAQNAARDGRAMRRSGQPVAADHAGGSATDAACMKGTGGDTTAAADDGGAPSAEPGIVAVPVPAAVHVVGCDGGACMLWGVPR